MVGLTPEGPPNLMNQNWQSLLEKQLNASIQTQTRIGGGDFAESRCITLSDKRRVFVKTHQNPPPNFFTTEAAGLTWLRETQTVPIPEVLWVSDNPPCLALQWITEGARVSSGEQQLGVRLAELHRSSFSTFGRPDSRTTGSLALPNTPSADWVTFYREQRLLPLIILAENRNALPANTLKKLATLCDNLERFAPPTAKPSLVHGDLWAGNRVIDQAGISWLIDPAAHGNHREFDIAMMRLFGGYEEDCFASYNEHFALDDGWVDRIPLFQLAPLIVHAIKFGGHYAAATHDAVSGYVD